MKQHKLKKEALFDLIKSMSKGEKRYFKLMSHLQTGDKGYLLLFDEIEKQSEKDAGEYDEDAIKRKFGKKKFVNNLHVVKKYLYEAILKTLRAHEKTQTIVDELIVLLHSIRILLGRGLYEQCVILLEKYKQKALEYERFDFLVLAYYQFDRVLYSEYIEHGYEHFYKIFVEHLKNLKNYETLAGLHRSVTHMGYMYYQYPSIRNKKEEDLYKGLQADLIVKDEKLIDSLTGKQMFYVIKGQSAEVMNDYKTSYENIKKRIALMESTTWMKKEMPFAYYNTLFRLPAYSSLVEPLNVVRQQIESIKPLYNKLDKNFPPARVTLLKAVGINSELHAYAFTKSFRDTIERIDGVEKFVSKNKKIITNYYIALFYWNFCYAFFFQKQYKKSLVYLNKLTDPKMWGHMESLIGFVKILQLIVHAELQNFLLLPYMVKSTYRYFLKKDFLHKSEKLILDFIRTESHKVYDNRTLEILYRKLLRKLEEFENDKYEKPFFKTFDLISWLKMRLS